MLIFIVEMHKHLHSQFMLGRGITRLCLLMVTPQMKKIIFGEAASFGVQSRQRTNHSKGVFFSLLLKYVQPWAVGAFRKVLVNSRTLSKIGFGVIFNRYGADAYLRMLGVCLTENIILLHI